MHTIPLCYILKDYFAQTHKTDIHIQYLVHPAIGSLLRYVPVIDKIIPIELNSKLSNIIQYIKTLNNLNLNSSDIFINLQPNWKSTGLINLICSPANKFIYSKNSTTSNEHVWTNFANTYFQTISNTYLKNSDITKHYPLLRMPSDIAGILPEDIQANINSNDTRKKLIFIPAVGKARAHRAWGIYQWIHLIQILKNKYQIFLVGGQEDINIASQIIAGLNLNILPVTNWTGKLSLDNLAKVFTHVDMTIGGDTGPLHISASLGTYTLGLYGPTSAIRHAPFVGDSIVSTFSCDMRCNTKKCQVKSRNCMDYITPIDIANYIHKYLDNKS